MKYLPAFALVLVLPLAQAHSQTLAQKNMIADDKPVVAERAAETNKKCGSHIAFSMDYPTFYGVKTDPTNPNDQSPWAFFADATDALNTICQTDDGKASVQAKIKAVVVSHAASASQTLTNGTLHFYVPYSGNNIIQNLVTFLEENL